MAKQILRVEPIHSTQKFGGLYRHNFRLEEVKNADPEKKGLNQELVALPAGETYISAFEEKIASLPDYASGRKRIRKNAILGYDILMSYGRKDIPKDFSIKDWCAMSKEFLIDKFGKDNILSVVLHMDETTGPHIHGIVVPIKDGRLCAREFLPDRAAYREMHQKYYSYMKELGLEPENRYMRIEHTKIQKFYAMLEAATLESLPAPEPGETLEAYYQRADKVFKEQSIREFGLETRLDQAAKERDALQKANRTLDARARQETRAAIEHELGAPVRSAANAVRLREDIREAIADEKAADPGHASALERMLGERMKQIQAKHWEESRRRRAEERAEAETEARGRAEERESGLEPER